jgi:outer membrane protein OmpA-like peptidoglycan-associated protein
MRRNRNRWTWSVLSVALLAACATTTAMPSQQLVDARQAYAIARQGPAATWAPSALLDAKRALGEAEAAVGSDQAEHYAYVALRLAQIAQARGDQTAAAVQLERAHAARNALIGKREQLAQDELARQRIELERRNAELEAERQARISGYAEADARSKELRVEREARAQAEKERNEAMQTLRELAAIQETERGLVVTLAGSLLFRSDEAVLLPIAQAKLDQVALALRQLGKNQAFVVEGHTDSRGSADFNRRLSAARAEAVRAYLVSRGVPQEQIVAVAKGEDQPIASNASPEGRANNRRVEIVIRRPPPQLPSG